MSCSHFVFVNVDQWSHIRPIACLSSRLLQSFPGLIITVTSSNALVAKTRTEFTRCTPAEWTQILQSRFRIFVDGATPEASGHSLARLLPALVDGVTITDAVDNEIQGRAGSIGMVCVDVCAGQVIPVIRQQAPQVPILAFHGPHLSALARLVNPVEWGGVGDVEAELTRNLATASPHADAQRIDHQTYCRNTGNVVDIPGVPEMYDYEYHPQEIMFLDAAKLEGIMQKALFESDGVLLPISSSVEPGILPAIEDHFQKPLFFLGPQVSPLTWADQAPVLPAEMASFLDAQAARSVLVISFGALFSPAVSQPWQMDALVDCLLDISPPLPFILAHGTSLVSLNPHQAELIRKSGRGLYVPWVPQEELLSHTSVGYFMSHCGSNGAYEGLLQGLPFISWPFYHDQSAFAAILEDQGIGITLLQNRIGIGRQPPYRSRTHIEGSEEAIKHELKNVLSRITGAEGVDMRRRAQVLQIILKEEHEKIDAIMHQFSRFL